MAYITDGTEWPEYPVDTAIRSLVELFFSLADLNSSEAGPRMAKEVFAPSGWIGNPCRMISGAKEIASSRTAAWEHITKRRHRISRVYVRSQLGTDLLIVGELMAELKNGKAVHSEFCARMVFDEAPPGGSPRLASYQVWTDPTDMRNATNS